MHGISNGMTANDLEWGCVACVDSVCLHITWKAHAACDLNIIVKVEGLLKVTNSHVHWKSDNIFETVLDRQATNRKWYSYTAYLIAAIVMTLSVLQSFPHCKPFQVQYFCTCAFPQFIISAKWTQWTAEILWCLIPSVRRSVTSL